MPQSTLGSDRHIIKKAIAAGENPPRDCARSLRCHPQIKGHMAGGCAGTGPRGIAPLRAVLEWTPVQAHATAHQVTLLYACQSAASAAFIKDWDSWREAGVDSSFYILLLAVLNCLSLFQACQLLCLIGSCKRARKI